MVSNGAVDTEASTRMALRSHSTARYPVSQVPLPALGSQRSGCRVGYTVTMIQVYSLAAGKPDHVAMHDLCALCISMCYALVGSDLSNAVQTHVFARPRPQALNQDWA